MYTFRRLMFALVAIVALVAATPAFAQNSPAPAPRFSVKPRFAVTPTTPTAPTTPAPQAEKQQGLGIFAQGGYVYQTTYTGGTDFSSTPQGFIAGIGFGGNKSGTFGVGVDLNYVWTDNTDKSLKTQYLNIPVYGRFNIGGHNTKNAFTFFIPVGWFFDINLSNELNGADVKNAFEGFQTGPLAGFGFEVYRVGLEARGQWSVSQLLKDGNDLGFTPDAKQFTLIVMFKVRLN
jgi:hypothetical protein